MAIICVRAEAEHERVSAPVKQETSTPSQAPGSLTAASAGKLLPERRDDSRVAIAPVDRGLVHVIPITRSEWDRLVELCESRGERHGVYRGHFRIVPPWMKSSGRRSVPAQFITDLE